MSDSAPSHGQVLRSPELWLPPEHPFRRLFGVGAALAGVGLLASFALGLRSDEARAQLWHSWLVAALFVLSIALGGLFFVLIQHATQAGWSVVVRRLAENAMATLPYLAVAFAPLLFGLGDLFHWSHADAVAADPLLRHKAPYLNVPFFLVRTVLYFAIWCGLALWYDRQSRLQDRTGEAELTRRMRRASPPALLLLALTTTFASFDWLMALQPHWYSTIFGVYFFSGSMVAIFAFLSLTSIALRRTGLLTDVISTEHLHDLGKFLFAFVVFWAYIGFSQFFLIWYGNIPEETVFFAARWNGSWRTASLLLAGGHFVVPFFFLLPRTIKRNSTALALAAVWLLAMHLLDLYWLVMPNLHPEGVAPDLLDLTALIGWIGVFVAAFGRMLQRRALVPLGDPRLPESLLFENP
jgi:hypothetical protein